MKKISFVITSLVRSGAEMVTVRLAKHYFELGHDVEIIMLLYKDIEIDLPKGIKIIDLSGNTKSRVKRIPYWLKNLKSHFEQRKPDVVISFIARINVITMMSIKNISTKIILSERNDPRYDSRTIITKLLINHYYPKANAIVFQTEEVSKLFSKRIQNKGVVIPNPIKITKYADMKNYDPNLILYAGRYSEQKNVITILKASQEVHKTHPFARFELYGTGPLKSDLVQYCVTHNMEDYVYIGDNIPNIREKMLDSSLFVMSSLYEGMSNSLLEASYSGIPCLTTPVLGSSIIIDGTNGYHFDFKDHMNLFSLISNLLDDNHKYKELRNNAIQIAKQVNFIDTFAEWDKIVL